VAHWDRLLVENTGKISALYSKTYQAERDAAEVERQLAFVENAQDELEQWLARYEQEAAEMSGRVVGSGAGDGGAAGVDLERERMYRLAEKVTAKLDDLNSDLGDVIAEINDVGARLSKVRQGDDPVSFFFSALLGAMFVLTSALALARGARAQQSLAAAAGH